MMNKIKNLRIKTRLLIAFMFVAVIMLCTFTVAVIDVNNTVAVSDEVVEKVIDPLEEMYHSIGTVQKTAEISTAEKTDEEVSGLKKALESLKSEAVVRSGLNRELLAKRMAELRAEIKSIKSNAYSRRNVDISPRPSQIDIRG